jgi:hypothetical protein
MTKEQLIEAIKTADIVNDDMWWENLECQISNPYARGYLAASVSCFNESLGFNTEDFREEILEKVEYDIWMEAPQPAGPVWVKAKHFKFAKGQYYHAQYSGAESLRGPYTWMGTGNLHHEAFWWSNPGHAPIAEKDFDRLMILDESAPALFTREQVSDAFHAGVCSGLDSANDRPFITQDEYMSTNYGDKTVK